MIRPCQTQDWEEHQMDKVSQHWNPTLIRDYRQWISSTHIIRQGTESTHKDLDTKLNNRKICFSDKKDKIRRGYNARGTFTTQEAYKLIIGNQTVKDPIWDKFWCYKTKWPPHQLKGERQDDWSKDHNCRPWIHSNTGFTLLTCFIKLVTKHRGALVTLLTQVVRPGGALVNLIEVQWVKPTNLLINI